MLKEDGLVAAKQKNVKYYTTAKARNQGMFICFDPVKVQT